MTLQITNIVETPQAGGVRRKSKGGYKWWKPKEIRQLRALVTEGKKVAEIAEIMRMPKNRIRSAKKNHIKRIRRKVAVPVKRISADATPKYLPQRSQAPFLLGTIAGSLIAAAIMLLAR